MSPRNRYAYANMWQTGMLQSPCNNPTCFCAALVLPVLSAPIEGGTHY
jgi:hypothetical protein